MTDYELWSFGRAWDETEPGWVFHGYARLNLSQVLQYESYGYCVRKVIGDRSSTVPLFPLFWIGGAYQDATPRQED